MNERKHPAIKALAVIVLVLLIACTFAARPLMAQLTTKVNTITARERRLEYTDSILCEEWYTKARSSIYIDHELSSSLKVDTVYVSRLDAVDKGDKLVSFDPISGETALDKAETALIRARIEYTDFMDSNTSPKGDRYTLVSKAYAEAEAAYEALMVLARDDWTLCSETDGYISDIDVYSGMRYYGKDVLFTICRLESEITAYIPITQQWQKLNNQYGVTVTVKIDEEEYTARWASTEERSGGLYARLIFEDVPDKLVGFRTVSLQAVSDQSVIVVPITAVHGDSVYVMRETDGYFGKEYIAERVTVEKGNDNGSEIEILRGLNRGDRVISDVLSEGELYDGIKVMYEIG